MKRPKHIKINSSSTQLIATITAVPIAIILKQKRLTLKRYFVTIKHLNYLYQLNIVKKLILFYILSSFKSLFFIWLKYKIYINIRNKLKIRYSAIKCYLY